MSEISIPAEDMQRGVWQNAPGESDPAPGLVPCPRCTDGVVDLVEHLKWCTETAAEQETQPAARAVKEVLSEKSEPEPDPIAAARALIAEDEQRRMTACLADIEAVLDRHGMTFDIVPARLTLAPKD
jgi:hypothetical protein